MAHSGPHITEPGIIHAHLSHPDVRLMFHQLVDIGVLPVTKKRRSETEYSIYANEAFYNYNSWKESIWYLLGTCTYCDGLKLWNGNCSSRKCLLSWTSILPPVIWTLLTFKENWKRLSWQCTWRCLNKSLMGTLTCVDKKWAEIIRTIL